MIKIDFSFTSYIWTAFFPAWKRRNEINRRCQFDIYLKLFFKCWKSSEQLIQFRIKTYVNVYGCVTPAHKNSCNPSGEIYAGL